MKTYEISGFYGSGKTPCTVFVAKENNNKFWYCVEGSEIVNCTDEELVNDVDIELVSDVDMFTWSNGIDSIDELKQAIILSV